MLSHLGYVVIETNPIMKILLITKDKSIFDERSHSHKELVETASYLEQIHVIVMTKSSDGYKTRLVGENIFIHPTNSISKWLYFYNALNTAERQVVVSFQLVADLIEADGPFDTALAAYLISRKYKKNFLIKISKNIESALTVGNSILCWIKRRLSAFVLDKAHGIMVPTQMIGEAIYARNQALENKIYIMPEPIELRDKKIGDETWDIRSAYSQFNVIILTVVDSLTNNDYQKLSNIMTGLVFNYRRAGLIIIEKHKRGSGKIAEEDRKPFIIVEHDVDDVSPYYRGAQVFLDISTKNKDGEAMMEAALSGCPIVSAPNSSSSYIVKENQNGFIVDPNNLNEVIHKIREIIETPGLKESIRLFRHQTEEMFAKTQEEYWPTLKEILKIVSEKKFDTPNNEIEEYASKLVYTLKRTRQYMHQATLKVESLESKLKNKMHMPGIERRKVTAPKHLFDISKEETFNVDQVLGKNEQAR